jgi:hypothetical protein
VAPGLGSAITTDQQDINDAQTSKIILIIKELPRSKALLEWAVGVVDHKALKRLSQVAKLDNKLGHLILMCNSKPRGD